MVADLMLKVVFPAVYVHHCELSIIRNIPALCFKEMTAVNEWSLYN